MQYLNLHQFLIYFAVSVTCIQVITCTFPLAASEVVQFRQLAHAARVTVTPLTGCGRGRREVLTDIGPVTCPCYLSYAFGSTADSSWDVFFLPNSSYTRWAKDNFSGDPSNYREEYTSRDIRVIGSSKTLQKFAETNVFLDGVFWLVFRASGQAEKCFDPKSHYVFEPMLPPCPVKTRVVGGTKVTDPEIYKWIASIWFAGAKAVCGGSLIAPGYILTAAHCRVHESPSSFEVRVGVKTVNDGKAYKISRAWAHPDYRELPTGAAWNDLAILELQNWDSSKDEDIIPWNKNASFPEPGNFVTTAGYGRISENWPALPVPNNLLRVDIPVMNTSMCSKLYRDIKKDFHLCAGYLTGGCDSCQGDSGGPLYARDRTRNSSFILVGLVSFGTGCARQRAPGVYTRISSYTEWINETISEGQASRRFLSLNRVAVASLSGGVVLAVVMGLALAVIAIRRRRCLGGGDHGEVVSRSSQPSSHIPSMSGISV